MLVRDFFVLDREDHGMNRGQRCPLMLSAQSPAGRHSLTIKKTPGLVVHVGRALTRVIAEKHQRCPCVSAALPAQPLHRQALAQEPEFASNGISLPGVQRPGLRVSGVLKSRRADPPGASQ